MYTIGQVAELYNFPISTLRYYDKEGLFPNLKRQSGIEQEIARLNKTLDLLNYKCWYYNQAIADGNEDGIHAMLPDKLPKNIQKLYDSAHTN